MSGHVLTFGETMGLFRAAEVGSLADIDTARIGTGGADSNVAIGLSRLGIRAAWVGRVAADGLGRRVVRDILGQGVDAHPIVDPTHPTGLMVKEKRTSHTTKVWFYRSGSAGSRLQPDDIERSLIATAALVHITGITASISASGRETVHRVLEVAGAHGVPVSFDVNHRSALWATGDPAAMYREIASTADIVFAGDDEAALLLGLPGADSAALVEGMRRLGPTTAVLKRGELGSIASDGDGALVEHPALSVPVVDTVGAGDAFVAGFLSGRLRGESLTDCLATATACGAFACMGWGDWESMPRSEELALLNGGDPVSR